MTDESLKSNLSTVFAFYSKAFKLRGCSLMIQFIHPELEQNIRVKNINSSLLPDCSICTFSYIGTTREYASSAVQIFSLIWGQSPVSACLRHTQPHILPAGCLFSVFDINLCSVCFYIPSVILIQTGFYFLRNLSLFFFLQNGFLILLLQVIMIISYTHESDCKFLAYNCRA